MEAYRVFGPGESAFQRRPRGDPPGRVRGPTLPERTGRPAAVLATAGRASTKLEYTWRTRQRTGTGLFITL